MFTYQYDLVSSTCCQELVKSRNAFFFNFFSGKVLIKSENFKVKLQTNDMIRELLTPWEGKLGACTMHKRFLYLWISEYAKISGLIVCYHHKANIKK